ncbi:MAG: hypothetical protein EOP32_37005 [Rhodococcus sp. (in: high G+C Gram-positive bacteria)]|nr:MAG: hypothetical protein EOP32_37005 [Rhodococcus sp. (in: high G+C Gram-positive bacteria)]
MSAPSTRCRVVSWRCPHRGGRPRTPGGDDESETVDALRSGRVRVHSFDGLAGLRVRELRATLTVGPVGGRPVTGCTGHAVRVTAVRHTAAVGTVAQGAD